jgi:hypothetical protein
MVLFPFLYLLYHYHTVDSLLKKKESAVCSGPTLNSIKEKLEQVPHVL